MVTVWLVAAALGQEPTVPELNAQTYRAPLDARGTLWAEGAGSIVDGWAFRPRLVTHYTLRPLAYVPDEGEPTWLVSDVLQADAMLSVAYDRLRLSAVVPVYLYSAGQLTDDGPGLGDVEVSGRLTLLDPAVGPLGLALHGSVATPTSTVAAPLGSAGLDSELMVAMSHYLGDVMELHANAGMGLGPRQQLENVTLDDALLWRVGGGYLFGEVGGLSLDLAGRAELADGVVAGVPVEALVGGWGQLDRQWALKLGVGRGLTQGIGSPQLRTVAMLALQPRAASDRDLDGLVDRYDQCPLEPEDRDQFRDDDGCPDPDNDADGILDVADRCADDPEDLDGYLDGDGCPDLSQRVAVAVHGPKGQVLGQARTRIEGTQTGRVGEGFGLVELHEGSYVVHATAEGFLPGKVAFEVPYDGERVVVVLQPAAAMGTLSLTVLDQMGLPVPLARYRFDGQGTSEAPGGTATLKLPAGVHQVHVEADGFVAVTEEVEVVESGAREHIVLLARPRVRVTATRIELDESIFFETGSAVIRADSHGVLDEVAGVLKEHPEIDRLRIEGHTDARGSAASNLRLSEARAASVRDYLVRAGVAAERLVSRGYGEDQPLVQGTGPAVWEKNRRVDLFIEQPPEAP